MKYKVGDKVRMIRDVGNAKEGYEGIIKAVHDGYYSVEFPCFDSLDGHDCDGDVKSNKGHFVSEGNLALLGQSLTFQEKLDRFMKEPVGFLVKSKEIADGLAKVFERNHMKPRGDHETVAELMDMIWKLRGVKTYVTYNYRKDEHRLSYGISDYRGDCLEILDVTIDELKEYLEPSPQTLDDKWENNSVIQCNYYGDGRIVMRKIKYAKRDGLGIITLIPEDIKENKQEDHMKITIETDGHHKTTAECNGITAESLCNPTDEFDLPKGVHMAVQRLLKFLKGPDEDTGFHVGDIVEVVANEAGFRGNPIGLQGIVKEIISDGAGVKLPIRKRPLYFYNRELKLIRRGNN